MIEKVQKQAQDIAIISSRNVCTTYLMNILIPINNLKAVRNTAYPQRCGTKSKTGTKYKKAQNPKLKSASPPNKIEPPEP